MSIALDAVMVLRPFDRARDESFVYSGWLHSFRRGNEQAHTTPANVYFRGHHDVISGILDRPTTKIAVLAAEDDHSLIYGWLCHEVYQDKWLMHYAYVKSSFRRFGLGRRLLMHVGLDMTKPSGGFKPIYLTHVTALGMQLIEAAGLRQAASVTKNHYWAHRPPEGA